MGSSEGAAEFDNLCMVAVMKKGLGGASLQRQGEESCKATHLTKQGKS
jgi:hypothetical protein